MDHQQTARDPAPRMPVASLRVDVIDGDDAGKVHALGSDSVTIGSAEGNDLVLRDPLVSRFHVELSRAAAGIRVVDGGSTNGTFFGSVRLERALVAPGTMLRVGRTNLRITDGDRVEVAISPTEQLGSLWGRSPAMRRVMAAVERAAKSQAAILIVGESGTGKEVIARTIQELSPRAQAPFVTVDCASLSPTLVASELFGHERGAFTGADRQHIGAFERASGGTLFLDEIGELPAPLQANLLGALERRRFRRLGGRTDVDVDLRIVSATNRDLRGEVNRGAFRLDLYYRLAVVVLSVPPLRERPEDIDLLVERFLRDCGESERIDELISPAAMQALRAHYWPGNARELRNMVEATVAMGEPPALEPPREGASTGEVPIAAPAGIPVLLGESYGVARGALLQEFESRYLKALVERTQGNVSQAAREAKMDRSHLIDMLRRHGLAAPKGR